MKVQFQVVRKTETADGLRIGIRFLVPGGIDQPHNQDVSLWIAEKDREVYDSAEVGKCLMVDDYRKAEIDI